MFAKNIVMGAAFLFATACSAKHDLLHERERSAPPQSAKDVGVVLEHAEPLQVEAILAQHPEAKVRVLNTRHGMYEIFNVNEEQIHREFEGSAVRNEFFKIAEGMTAPAGLQLGSLASCKSGAKPPTAVLTSSMSDTATIELGTTVKLNGTKSTAAAGDEAPLKMAFSITFPPAAAVQQSVQEGPALEFTPDTLGLHQVFLVVQGADGECSMEGIRFLVTANRPYTGPAAAPVQLDLAKFNHLAMVHAAEAWELSRGDGVVIAVLDTGVDYNHPLLAPNIQVNENEIPDNQIDDDGNGFIDDYAGYDFVNRDGYPYDDDGHGTHVAGLAAAKQFGLAPNAKILPVKVLTSLGTDSGTIAAGIRYAVDRHANIINLSLGAGGPLPNPVLVSAVAYAAQKGVIIVGAAGNGDPATGLGFDLDKIPVWPVSLKSENVIGVAAFDALNVLSPYSNYGATSVDTVAPGGLRTDPMFSCAYENTSGALFAAKDGTSMAGPVVSGIIADIWSKSPGLSVKDIKDILHQTGPEISELKPITISGRHVDALASVHAAAVKNVLF